MRVGTTDNNTVSAVRSNAIADYTSDQTPHMQTAQIEGSSETTRQENLDSEAELSPAEVFRETVEHIWNLPMERSRIDLLLLMQFTDGQKRATGYTLDTISRKQALSCEDILNEPRNEQQRTESHPIVTGSFDSRLGPKTFPVHHYTYDAVDSAFNLTASASPKVSRKSQPETRTAHSTSEPSVRQSYMEKNSYGSEVSMKRTEKGSNSIYTGLDLGPDASEGVKASNHAEFISIGAF
jgi:hypothetical protein